MIATQLTGLGPRRSFSQVAACRSGSGVLPAPRTDRNRAVGPTHFLWLFLIRFFIRYFPIEDFFSQEMGRPEILVRRSVLGIPLQKIDLFSSPPLRGGTCSNNEARNILLSLNQHITVGRQWLRVCECRQTPPPSGESVYASNINQI